MMASLRTPYGQWCQEIWVSRADQGETPVCLLEFTSPTAMYYRIREGVFIEIADLFSTLRWSGEVEVIQVTEGMPPGSAWASEKDPGSYHRVWFRVVGPVDASWREEGF